MFRVEAKGMTCWSDTCRYVGHRDVVLISLFGPRNAVRAAWATFFNRKRWPSVEVGDDHARRVEDAAYSTIQTPMGKDLHTIIVHAAATRQHSSFADAFFQVGPRAEERFFDRLARRCPVPMRPSWRDEIWRLGIEKDAIWPLAGFGLPVHHVRTEGEIWAPIVKEALVSGRLR